MARAKSKPEFVKSYSSTVHLYTDEDDQEEEEENDMCGYLEYDDSDDYEEEEDEEEEHITVNNKLKGTL